jgi:hypothetical protein
MPRRGRAGSIAAVLGYHVPRMSDETSGRGVSGLPDGLRRERHLDLRSRRFEPWARRAVLAVILAGLALGLANVFGQHATSSSSAGAAGELSVTIPDRLRGGVLGQGTIRLYARRRIAHPRLVLDRGWLDGITINTISPEAADQDGDDQGRVVLAYGELEAGASLTVRIAFQVNPTTLGSDPQGVELRDGDELIARVERTVVVFP